MCKVLLSEVGDRHLHKMRRVKKSISIWLLIGIGMVLIQIVLGGVTRLTGSGLSITKWEIVTGTLPPLNTKAWKAEFDLYKNTPQYKIINQDMDLKKFKFIYFWEYVHRLWARLMGFVFLFPLIYFIGRKYIPRWLIKHLILIFLLAAGTASAGWIMVQSGLVKGPWVNAYKLTAHLIMACFTLIALTHTYLKCTHTNISISTGFRKLSLIILVIIILQISFGGMVAGMRSAVAYPTWPDMNGQFIPEIIYNMNQGNVNNVVNYYDSQFAPALTQFIHRIIAYILYVLVLLLTIKLLRSKTQRKNAWLGLVLINVQLLLGILTLLMSKGYIPLLPAVMHQLVAFLIFIVVYKIYYVSKSRAELVPGG